MNDPLATSVIPEPENPLTQPLDTLSHTGGEGRGEWNSDFSGTLRESRLTGSASDYELVRLKNGVHSIRSRAEGETFHPVIGPAAEAQALYVEQLRIPERMTNANEEFVIWDIGLGAAANVLTVLHATREVATPVRIISFDWTLEPLRFAVEHAEPLGYFHHYADAARELLGTKSASFNDGRHRVAWSVIVDDFPTFVASEAAMQLPKPHAILFDAFSPAKNPDMWTLPLFQRLFDLLDPERPCAMPTYSRSTLLRVTWLLAGFQVGFGEATGEKEQTTIAANTASLIEKPLDREWLERAHRSTSAEPLHDGRYVQQPILPESWARLTNHPQFRAS